MGGEGPYYNESEKPSLLGSFGKLFFILIFKKSGAVQPDSSIISVQPLFFESQGEISIGRELLRRAAPAGTLSFQASVNRDPLLPGFWPTWVL